MADNIKHRYRYCDTLANIARTVYLQRADGGVVHSDLEQAAMEYLTAVFQSETDDVRYYQNQTKHEREET